MEEKEVGKLIETLKTMKKVDWQKVIKVLARIQQVEGRDDKELNNLLDRWEEVYGDVFDDPLRCSFCGKNQKDVRKLVAGPGVYICDECIELCCEILEDEFGKSDVSEDRSIVGEKTKLQYERELPRKNEIWHHFKGNDYKIIACPVTHTETREPYCIYQALYGDFGSFCRPLSMFMSEVDREKYPQAEQKYRFEKKDRCDR